MQLLDFIKESNIEINLKAQHKKAILRELVQILVRNGSLKDTRTIMRNLWQREKMGSTAIGYSIAIPHARMPHLKQILMAIGLSKNGVNFQALDNQLTHIFFLLVVPKNSMTDHLRLMAHISGLLLDPVVRRLFLAASHPNQVIEIIRERQKLPASK